ncbi:protein mono-ADP-ribosyltransferase PARP12-like, partial [Gigantopelta aegis]|uniref:protein mono-ADP-ribosyltransferase PARP12-like n=1 Tax=Gigantopelta aegis TaxID=1735272 RepID=UPI001B88A1E8
MVLLEQGGQLKIDQLYQDLTNNEGVQMPNVQSLLIFLDEFPRNFVINTVRHRRKTVSDVRVISDIETCVEHCKKQGSCRSQNGECGRLHICKFFLLSGHCHFGPGCAFGHDFTSRHNFNVFMSYMLDPRYIKAENMRDLLCQNECRNATTMPDTCKFYNTSKTCSNKRCRSLHICRHFLEGTCKFGSYCRRNHSVEESSVMDILEDYGFDVDQHPEVILEDLQNFYQNNTSTNIRSSQPPGLSYRSRSVNNLADALRMSVFDPPPQRQRGRSAGRWRERDRTSFEDYIGTSFEDDIGSLERYWMRSPQPDDFSSNSDREQEAYVPTLRRPPSAVPAMPVPWPRTKRSPPVMALPPKPAISTFRSVSKESTLKICIHYLRGKCLFGGKCRYHHKSTIYQWQWKRNTDLDWTDFEEEENITLEKSFSHVEEAECNLKIGKREQMKRKLGKDVDERQLFHGTHVDNIEAICHQGFDFRFCGKAVGTLHGKGSYFSTEAGYSDSYTVNCGKMFIALTLVGDFSKGNQSFVRPPPKIDSEPHGDLFDSCVDNVKNPKIFAIFDLYQVYPQYLIT